MANVIHDKQQGVQLKINQNESSTQASKNLDALIPFKTSNVEFPSLNDSRTNNLTRP